MTGTDRAAFTPAPTAPQPVVILVNPQMGENIGAAARAMLNCGLAHLRLVNPRDGWPNDRADAMAAGALELMPPVAVYATLAAAVADCHTVYATTARPRDMVKPVMTPRHAAGDMHQKHTAGQQLAILFGAERSGLSNEELEHAHNLITIPLNAGFSSLNLGQSVLLVAYEWSQQACDTDALTTPMGKSLPATAHEFNIFFDRLDKELQARRFYRVDEMKDYISRNIRALFSRAQPTDQEICTLHGIVTALTRRDD